MSDSCRMMTFLVSVQGRWPQLIVSPGDSLVRQQQGELQKRFPVERRVREDRNVSRGRCEHPHRDFQPFACWIDHRDRAVAPLGPTKDA
ncbi:MAG: hypothetical protein JOZ45_23245 [Acidobacteriaceae bacterium]|nr:hypothetical protein [Acidobacteriaceae bacterium]